MELISHHQLEEFGKDQKETCLTTSQNPCWHPFWLNKACTTRKDSESEWLAKDNPETNPIAIKPETASHRAVLLGSLILLLSTWVPFPVKSLALSAHVSLQTIHFWVLDKSPLSGPRRGPLSFNSFIIHEEANQNGFLRKR